MDAPPSTRILALSEATINRIAAGEVVQRACSAVKELLENCVDAGGSAVVITVKDGGRGYVEVRDNGRGIHADDMSRLCQRFNTSKLRQFEDLKTVQTFGFRGEALASISHVARVTITTQPSQQQFSLRASYQNGQMTTTPQKVAGNAGTTILVEDLFYNSPARLRALKNHNEEYNLILEVVQKYAVHFAVCPASAHPTGVGFKCKRASAQSCDVNTTSQATQREVVQGIFGRDVAQELLAWSASDLTKGIKVNGLVTNGNFSMKHGEFLLFINNRLVDCAPLKRCVDFVYSECLPKGSHPFIYLALELAPETVDVNVHPTKREVQFLNQDVVCTLIQTELGKVLKNANSSRTFSTSALQTQLSLGKARGGGTQEEEAAGIVSSSVKKAPSSSSSIRQNTNGNKSSDDENEEETSSSIKHTHKKHRSSSSSLVMSSQSVNKRPDRFVRTDATQSAIDGYLVVSRTSSSSLPLQTGEDSIAVTTKKRMRGCGHDDHDANDNNPCCSHDQSSPSKHSFHSGASSSDIHNASGIIPRMEDLDNAPLILADSDALSLASVHGLLNALERDKDNTTCDIMKQFVYVGTVDDRLSLIQSGISLLMVRHDLLIQELLYQRVLALFGRFKPLIMSPTPLNMAGLIGDKMAASILPFKDLLFEYFGIDVRTGDLVSLPKLVSGHVPQISAIPDLLRALHPDVINYSDEIACFHDIARALALAYSQLPVFEPLCTTTNVNGTSPNSSSSSPIGATPSPSHNTPMIAKTTSIQYVLKSVLFPAAKKYLICPRRFSDTTKMVDPNDKVFSLVTRLEDLYKVFERC